MRDINRIPKILKELERVWKENPDYRLGQLIVVATKPETPTPSIFYIEDEDLLPGLLSIGKTEKSLSEKSERIPYWKKYPDICRMEPEEITLDMIQKMILKIQTEHKNIVITPNKLIELTGAPASDSNWMLKQKDRISKLKVILSELKENGILEEIQIGYNIKTK